MHQIVFWYLLFFHILLPKLRRLVPTQTHSVTFWCSVELHQFHNSKSNLAVLFEPKFVCYMLHQQLYYVNHRVTSVCWVFVGLWYENTHFRSTHCFAWSRSKPVQMINMNQMMKSNERVKLQHWIIGPSCPHVLTAPTTALRERLCQAAERHKVRRKWQ